MFLSSKAVLLFFKRIKTHKQTKLWKWDPYSKVLNSLATFLRGWVLINTSSLIIFCCWWSFLAFNMPCFFLFFLLRASMCLWVLIVDAYLTGAPLLWAGLSSTVTVLSVWFREVSWSYAGMEGAEEKTKQRDVLPHCKSKVQLRSTSSHSVYRVPQLGSK